MRAFGWALLATLLMLPSSAAAAERAYAIVIGNNEPPAGTNLSTLRFADDDALRYAEFLRQFADDVRLHAVLDGQTRKRFRTEKTSGPPTLASVRRSVRELAEVAASRRDAGDRVTFYLVFSAHGAIGDDGEAYVSLLDAPLSRRVLFEDVLAQLPADRVHLIIDACHAAGVVGLRGKRAFGKEVEATVEEVDEAEAERWVGTRTLARFPHVGVLAATTAGEQAHEWSTIESGVFSHEVLSALWGAGDINGDLKVEYSEVQAFVSAANRRVDDPKKIPNVVSRPPPDDPHDPVADLSAFQSSVMITGDASALGHFHIERHHGARHLDANLGSSSITVAIPAGSASFLRAGSEEIELRGAPGQTIDLSRATRSPAEVDARGSTGATYRRALFREPYTPDYYRGYVDSLGVAPVVFAPRTARRPRAGQPPRPAAAVRPVTSPPTLDKKRRAGPAQRRRRTGIAFAVIASGTGVASIVTGALAGSLRTQFNRATTETDAHALDRRHRPLATAAIVTGAVALTSTIIAIATLAAKR